MNWGDHCNADSALFRQSSQFFFVGATSDGIWDSLDLLVFLRSNLSAVGLAKQDSWLNCGRPHD